MRRPLNVPNIPLYYFSINHSPTGELAGRSNALAHTLIDLRVARGEPVGIFMDKSIYTAVALYGIMKAGAPYVPLDPSAPLQRLAAMIQHCGIRVLVSAENKLKKLLELSKIAQLDYVVGIDAQHTGELESVSWTEVESRPQEYPPKVKIVQQDLAYIMYTSGSTGTPKGMMHTHHSGLSFATWARDEYGFHAEDVLSNHAPLHFDLSTMDYFSAICAGCTTAIIPEAYTKLPASYSQLLADQRITVLYTVPHALIQLSLRGVLEERDLSALRWAIFGGEPMVIKHLVALMEKLPHVRFDNIYGPAEVNGVTHYTIESVKRDASAIPIGPIASSAEALIVDDEDEPVAPGVSGELLVRTPTMMQGYWGRPDLNEDAFYRRTTPSGHEHVFYRTGDLVHNDAENNLWFLGRKDRQVKIRGYRIELDEIEAALAAIDTVEEAGAFVTTNDQSENAIQAGVILKTRRRA